MFLVISFLMCT